MALRYVDNFGKVTETYPATRTVLRMVLRQSRLKVVELPYDAAPGTCFPYCQQLLASGNWGEDGPWMRIFRNARKQLG